MDIRVGDVVRLLRGGVFWNVGINDRVTYSRGDVGYVYKVYKDKDYLGKEYYRAIVVMELNRNLSMREMNKRELKSWANKYYKRNAIDVELKILDKFQRKIWGGNYERI